MNIEPLHYFLLSAALFSLGLGTVLTRRNAVLVLMGIEIMLNAAGINLAGFARQDPERMGGTVFVVFLIVIAAAATAVGLAIILQVYDKYSTIQVDEIQELKD